MGEDSQKPGTLPETYVAMVLHYQVEGQGEQKNIMLDIEGGGLTNQQLLLLSVHGANAYIAEIKPLELVEIDRKEKP